MGDDDTPHTEDGSPPMTESSIRALIRAELRTILPNPTASTAPTASMAPTTSVVTSTSPHSGKPNHKAHVLPLPLARHLPFMQSVSISVISITVHTHVAGSALGQTRYYLWRRMDGGAVLLSPLSSITVTHELPTGPSAVARPECAITTVTHHWPWREMHRDGAISSSPTEG